MSSSLEHLHRRDRKLQKQWQSDWAALIERGNPIDTMNNHKNTSTDKPSCLMNKMLPPKDKYRHPILSSQALGWYPSLELFGIPTQGIKRFEISPVYKGLWRQ